MEDLNQKLKTENSQKKNETIKREIKMPVYYIW